MAVVADPAELDVTPTLDEVRALARDHSLIPLRHTFIDDCETPVSADPYAAVADEIARHRPAAIDGLPPFAGGAVGMFGYDLVRTFEPSVGQPNPDELGMPDLAVMVSHVLLAFDHFTHAVTVIAYVVESTDGTERSYERALEAIAAVRERLRAPVPRSTPSRPDPPAWT